MNLRTIRTGAICFGAVLLLTACGGGGGGGGGSSSGGSLSGLAATGAAIPNSNVVARCIGGPDISGTTDAGGQFNLQLTPAHTLPCLLRVNGGTPATTLYSFANQSGQINISPATDLIVSHALGADPSTAFNTFNSSHATNINSGLYAAKNYVNSQLRALTSEQLQQDPMTGRFVVGDADDKVLDALGYAMASAGKGISDLRSLAATGAEIKTAVPATSALGTPYAISPTSRPGLLENSIAALLDDNSTLLFDSYGLVYQTLPIALLRLSSTGGVLETIEVTNSPLAFQPQIQADHVGGAVIAWLESRVDNGEYRREIHVRRYDRHTGLGPEIRLDTGIVGRDLRFELSVRPDGSATIAWVHQPAQLGPTGSFQQAIFVSEYRIGSNWSMGQQLSPLRDYELMQLSVAASPNGNTMVLWTENTDVGSFSIAGKLVARYKPAAGTWQAAATVENDQSSWEYGTRFSHVQLSIGDSGNALAVWSAGDTATRHGQYGLKFNRFQTNTGWLGTQTFSQEGYTPLLAMNGNGQGFLGWTVSGARYDPTVFWVARFDESGWLGTATALNQDTASTKDASGLRILVDNDGTATALFSSVQNRLSPIERSIQRVRKFSSATGWGTATSLPPYGEQVFFSTVTDIADHRATLIWHVGDYSGGRSTLMMLNFSLVAP